MYYTADVFSLTEPQILQVWTLSSCCCNLVLDCSAVFNCAEECNSVLAAREAEADFSHSGRALGSNNRLLKVKRCEAQLDSHPSLNPPR